jgi:hypothetical protein
MRDLCFPNIIRASKFIRQLPPDQLVCQAIMDFNNT